MAAPAPGSAPGRTAAAGSAGPDSGPPDRGDLPDGGPAAGAGGRILLALLPAALFLYGFYRAGMQVTGGLDPNFTVNAWGGPSYPGAMACHYLDLFALMAAAAWLLDKILLPDPAGSRSPGDRSPGGGLIAGRGHGRLAQADAAVVAGHPVMHQDPEATAGQPGDDPVGQQQILEHPAGQRHQ